MSDRKTAVLFVDDEANLLKGLSRMLRTMRDCWDLSYFLSAKEALAYMDTHTMDVVVSDMRMPEMDGAEFLSEVRRRQPGTIRIVLSGFAKNEAVMRTVGPSHQYLAKPCKADVLIDTIKRSLNLRRLMKSDDLRTFISGIDSLPSPPRVLQDLISALDDPNSSADTIAKLIERDVGLIAKILKLTNSAYFGLPQEVGTIRQSVQLLGTETLKSLIALSEIFDAVACRAPDGTVIDRLSQRSLTIGKLARLVAAAEGLKNRELEFARCGGLLSHVGTLILLANCSEQYREVGRLIDVDGLSLIQAEKMTFSATHGQIGAYLLGLWGFSYGIVETVAYHHVPSETAQGDFCAIDAVHVAQALAKISEIEDRGRAAVILKSSLDNARLAATGRYERVDAWLNLLDDTREETA